VLHKGALIFALIITVLFVMIFFQHQRSEEAVRSVDHTRQVIAYIDALRTYCSTWTLPFANTPSRRIPPILTPA